MRDPLTLVLLEAACDSSLGGNAADAREVWRRWGVPRRGVTSGSFASPL
jgi:hypothetical protein